MGFVVADSVVGGVAYGGEKYRPTGLRFCGTHGSVLKMEARPWQKV